MNIYICIGKWKEDGDHINMTSNIKIFTKQHIWYKIDSKTSEQNGHNNKAFEFQNFASSWLQCNDFFYKATIRVIQNMFYWLEIKKRVNKPR